MSQGFNMFKGIAASTVLVLAAVGSAVQAQPSFGNPSPTAGTSTSDKANAAADAAAYKEVEYTNKNKRGPALIVIPGEIKSNNANFTQRFCPTTLPTLQSWNCPTPTSRYWSGPTWGHW